MKKADRVLQEKNTGADVNQNFDAMQNKISDLDVESKRIAQLAELDSIFNFFYLLFSTLFNFRKFSYIFQMRTEKL